MILVKSFHTGQAWTLRRRRLLPGELDTLMHQNEPGIEADAVFGILDCEILGC